ncbi:MAG: DUF3617 family protein [Thermoanaerobaculia bacterium]
MRNRSLTLVAVLLLVAAVAFAGPQKPGKWKVTIETVMADMPMKMPPMTTTVCLSEKDVEDPQKAMGNMKGDCKVTDLQTTDNKVSYNIDCPSQKMKGHAEFTFTDSSYKGLMKMKVDEQSITQKYSGEHLGACEKK